MLEALVAVLIAAAPASANEAKVLAKAKNWDELYLAFSAADPSKFPAEERRAIGQALNKGCEALQKKDAVMAYSLGDKAVAFEPAADALLCLAHAGRATQQRGAAEQALRQGLSQHPERASAFALLLGQQLLEDRDPAGALAFLSQVPKRTKEYGPAQALLKKARAQRAEEQDARQQAKALERRIARGEPTGDVEPARATSRGAAGSSGAESASLTYASGEGPGGMRTRANGRFVLKYFNNDRDFGQRAEYEGQIAQAMDDAYETSQRILGEARGAPVDVVLYSREEFAAHFSARTAQRVAGFYFGDSIRVNDAAELSRENRATLVHEYIHAVVDDLTGGQSGRLPHWLNEGLAEYVEWRYLGSDGPRQGVAVALKGAARSGRLPQLADMDRGAPINSADPALAYGFSAVAVRLLLADGGAPKLLGLIREVGSGKDFEQAMHERYGRSVGELQEQARGELH